MSAQQPASSAPPVQPSVSVSSALLSGVSPLAWVWAAIGFLPMLIFSYGAAKVNWTVNQSYFWAILAFLFSGFYYPYYAFFQAPSGVSGIMQAVGARRRR